MKRTFTVMAMVMALAMSMMGAALASSTVTVTEDDVVDDPADLEDGDWLKNIVGEDSGIGFVTEYNAPEGLGEGALQLTTEDDNDARAELGTVVDVPLANVGSLDYWTYQPEGNIGRAAVAYKMVVTGKDFWTTLIYEPYWQNGTGDDAPVESETWQNWQKMEDGNWWSSSTSGGLDAGFGGPPFYTLDDVLELQPDATVESIQLGIGSFNPDWSVLADGMTFAGTTYDFEPAPEEEADFRSCFDGGWEGDFRNQGQCVASFQATDANPNARFNH